MKKYLFGLLKEWAVPLSIGSWAIYTVLSMFSYGFFGFGLWPWAGLEDGNRALFLFIFFVASAVGGGISVVHKIARDEYGRRY